jgi:hypothetical protein
MIDFIRFPKSGLPLLNLNGHGWDEAKPTILRIAKMFEANALLVHAAREDVTETIGLDVVPSKNVGLDEGRLLKNGVNVVTIAGLGITENMLKRAKGEVAPDDPTRLETRKKLEAERDALITRAQLITKVLETT